MGIDGIGFSLIPNMCHCDLFPKGHLGAGLVSQVFREMGGRPPPKKKFASCLLPFETRSIWFRLALRGVGLFGLLGCGVQKVGMCQR